MHQVLCSCIRCTLYAIDFIDYILFENETTILLCNEFQIPLCLLVLDFEFVILLFGLREKEPFSREQLLTFQNKYKIEFN